jgi:hypothetical protein
LDKSTKNTTKGKIVTLLIATVSLFFGGMVYVLFRPAYLLMFDWFDAMGIMGLICQMRQNSFLLLPHWIENSLPDGLWIFSYSLGIGCIWNFNTNQSVYYLLLLPLIAIVDEFLQIFNAVPGTFDPQDLFAYSLGSIFGISYVKLLNKINKLEMYGQ